MSTAIYYVLCSYLGIDIESGIYIITVITDLGITAMFAKDN